LEDDARREIGGLGTSESLERLAHVRRGHALEVEPGDQGVNRWRAPQVGGQDRRAEANAVNCILAGPVADAWLLNFEWPSATEDGASRQVAVAYDAAVAGIVTQPVELAQDLSNFELKSALEKLTSAFAHQLVEQRGWTVKRAVSNFGHGAYRSFPGCSLINRKVRHPSPSADSSPTFVHISCIRAQQD